jgi:hypothetical protein
MCGLCSDNPTERKNEIDHCDRMAAYLKELHEFYRRLANGTTDPHSPASQSAGLTARALIRALVSEYI